MTDSAPLPQPSAAALERALVLLQRKLGSHLLTEREETESYRSDDSRIQGPPPVAVVLAESTEHIRTCLEIAHETGVPVTPRAGGSGRTGGAVPLCGGIVLATQGMNSLIEIDRNEGLAVVEPGLLLADLHQAVEAEGWFYPPDPNSAKLCCLAGNLAENAAGPRAFKYGSTRDYVLGVETFLTQGQQFFSGRRTKKGVTGYDLVSLLVGSEGTLAVFGNITLRLIPRPEGLMTLLVLFSQRAQAANAVQAILRERLTPRCLEFLDEKTLSVVRQHGYPLPEQAASLLLIEVDGSESECERQAELIGNICSEQGALEVSVATTESARKRLWELRQQMSFAVRARARHKISEDVVVPRMRLTELLEAVERIGDTHRIDALAYGHAGDGNLHVNFLWNDEEEVPRVHQAIAELFQTTIELGGTLSGEHGIGILKAPYLPLEQPASLIALQKQIKQQFDPRGVLNPGKIFPTGSHRAC